LRPSACSADEASMSCKTYQDLVFFRSLPSCAVRQQGSPPSHTERRLVMCDEGLSELLDCVDAYLAHRH
jgi:hypothetical protein